MEEPPREGEAEAAERRLSKRERQCAAEAEQGEPPPAELQAEAAAEAAGLKSERQRLWQLFQRSAAAVAQLCQEPGCAPPGRAAWDPFQSAAAAVSGLYRESGAAARRSWERGVRAGGRRRTRDVLEWAQRGRGAVRREDLIGFLCGKAPPAGAPGRPAAPGGPAADVDLQLFREAAAPRGLGGAVAGVVRPAAPPAPARDGGVACRGRPKSSLLGDDLHPFGPEEPGPRLDGGDVRKRASAPRGDGGTNSPAHKRHRTA
ncbi:PREDICTED: UPF0472 protein C16orf72 [Chinchilla lanigera]|uniref:UPF0472 protein C16orf72 n=1 Tax=Chinchilla lanigera TaxID=34839 RepID=UPI000697E818|nr:PREDICTED: UPF0472 protein C16orf72 [Chinchilla lanigera]